MSFRELSKRVLGFALLVSLFGAGCTKGPDAATVAASKRTTLTIWGVVDDSTPYDAIFADYHKLHPFVSIEYRRFRLEEYEDQLLNALAEDRGPDVFLIHNTWVGKYSPKIQPMPPSTKMAEQVVVGTIQKTVQYQLTTQPTVTLARFKSDYPDVVSKDFIRTVNVSTIADKRDLQPRVLAIPVSVDTLGMYVNKDLLNIAGIPTVPENWDDFQKDVKLLVKQDAEGNILQAGAALGTSSNIDRASDLVSLLMMQNGAVMTADDGAPTFTSIPPALSGLRDVPPAYQALSFYTDFSNPGKDVYTWNDKQPKALDAFVQGKVAFYFGYNYDLPTIKARASKLNLAIAKVPQITGNPVGNFANYWGWTVSKKSKNIDIAWNFLNFLRTPDESLKYVTAAKRPAALKSQLPAQLDDEEVGVFASQVLTAQSWYKGNDPQAAEDAFMTMIQQAQSATTESGIPNAVKTAAEKISQTIPYGGI